MPIRKRLQPIFLCALVACNDPAGPLQCGGVITAVPTEAAPHVAQGSAIVWSTNPPAIGKHYPTWAPWARAFATPVPRGNYVHNLEHGGVVLLYRATETTLVQNLSDFGESLAQDALCSGAINARWILTPDPLLPAAVSVAAVTWGFTYMASCFDESTLRAFVSDHYAKGAEQTCAQGAISW